MCLTDVRRGQQVRIERIEDEDLRTRLIRFGIAEGSCIRCLERIPFGPFMVGHHRQELAIGREIAGKIFVREEA
jgi:ferrous iron transport protein A